MFAERVTTPFNSMVLQSHRHSAKHALGSLSGQNRHTHADAKYSAFTPQDGKVTLSPARCSFPPLSFAKCTWEIQKGTKDDSKIISDPATRVAHC